MFQGPRNRYEFGPFRVDVQERTLSADGAPVPLTEKVFDLLLLLLNSRGRALGKAEIMQALWPDTVVEEGNLTVNVSVLRKALGESAGERRYIETLPRRGYRFVAEVRELDAQPALPAAAAPPANPMFVGRERELERLRALVAGARGGRGRLVFITGEPGLGKTELCEQLLASLPSGTWVARGRCLEQFGSGEAYLPFLEAWRALASGPDASRVLPVLRQHAPTWCAEVGVDADLALRGPAGASAARMLREMGGAVEALCALEPLLLVLEDMHWADPSSSDLLSLLGQRAAPLRLLVVATFRDAEVELENHPMRSVRRELLAHDQCEELPLSLLERPAIERYLGARFSGRALPPELAELLARTTEGHPLFITRLVQLMLERGELTLHEESVALARPAAELELGVPQSVRGLIQKKLESLDAEDQRALAHASVIGVEFSSAALAGLLEQDEVSVEERLDRLARPHRLLEPLGEEQRPGGRPTLAYRFAHVLYRNVLYDGLASKRRMLLHERAARWLLAEHGTDRRRAAAQLALHYEAARDAPNAIEFLQLAADNAARIFADREAERYYARALELLDQVSPEDRVALGVVLAYNHGWCAFKLRDYPRCARDFETLLELARAPEFAGEGAAAERARARVFDFFAEPWRDAYGMLDMPRMPNQPRTLGARAIQSEAYDGLCYLWLNVGQFDALGARAREFLELAERSQNEPRRLEALSWLVAREVEQTNLDAASELLERALEPARRIRHERALYMLCDYAGRIHHLRAEYAQAEALRLEALPFGVEVRGRIDVLMQIARARAHLGRLPEALSALHEASDFARRSGMTEEQQGCSALIGWIYLEAGNLARAIRELESSLALARAEDSRRAEMRVRLHLARAYAEQGRLEVADAALARAEALAPELASGIPDRPRRAHGALPFHVLRAELGLRTGDLARAQGASSTLLELAGAQRAPKYQALACWLRARLELARGNGSGAEREARAGHSALDGRPLPLVTWRLWDCLGRSLRAQGDGAAAAEAQRRAREEVARIESGVDGAGLSEQLEPA